MFLEGVESRFFIICQARAQEDNGQCLLALDYVPTGRLAQVLSGLGDVQEVIHELKSRTESNAEGVEVRAVGGVDDKGRRAAGLGEQAGGLQLGELDTNRAGIILCKNLYRPGHEVIAAEDGRMVVPHGVERGGAAAEQGLVDYVVVGQRGDVKGLESGGELHILLEIPATDGACRKQAQGGPEHLPPRRRRGILLHAHELQRIQPKLPHGAANGVQRLLDRAVKLRKAEGGAHEVNCNIGGHGVETLRFAWSVSIYLQIQLVCTHRRKQMQSDQALWRLWAERRDADAFGELVLRYAGVVFGTCRRVLGNAAEAEDVAQDCFVELMSSRVKVETSLAPWLHTMAVRRSLDRLKAGKRRQAREQRYGEALVHPEHDLANAEVLALLDEAIEGLPAHLRKPLVERFMGAKTHEAIAAGLGVGESTVRKRIRDGIERLRSTLRNKGVMAVEAVLLAALEAAIAEAAPMGLTQRVLKQALAASTVASPAAVVWPQLLASWLFSTPGAVVVGAVLLAAGVGVALMQAGEAPEAAPPEVTHTSVEPQRTEGAVVAAAAPAAAEATGANNEATGVVNSAGTTSAPMGNGTLFGLVLDGETELPVPAAQVRIEYRNWREEMPDRAFVWTANTDEDGKFLVRAVRTFGPLEHEQFDYLLTVSHEGNVGTSSARPTDGEAEAYSQILLWPSGRISGRVLDADGGAVPDCTLIPLRVKDKPAIGPVGPAVRTKTNARGEFILSEISQGSWKILAVSPNHALGVVDSVSSGTKDLEIRLQKGGTVQGQVVLKPDGTPLAGFKISPQGIKTGWSRWTETNAEGRFVVPHLADDVYLMGWEDTTHVVLGQPRVEISQSATTADLTVEVAVGAAIAGRVYDANTNVALPNVCVVSPGAVYKAVTDAEGKYLLRGVPQGTAEVVRKYIPGYVLGGERERKRVTARLGETTAGVDFALSRGVTVRGTVVDKEREPILGAAVMLRNRDVMEEVTHAFTSEDGSFEVGAFSPGCNVQLTATANGYSHYLEPSLELGQEDNNELQIVLGRGGSISGVVVDPTGRPVEGQSLTADGENGLYGFTSRVGGKFVQSSLPAGVYQIKRNRGDAASLAEVTLAEGQRVTGLRVILREEVETGVSISGVVVNLEGKPISQVFVKAENVEGEPAGSFITGEDGTFNISKLEKSNYFLSAQGHSHSTAELGPIAAGTRQVRFVLSARGAIEGTVVASGAPVGSFEVATSKSTRNGGRSTDRGFLPVVDVDGHFRLEGVDTGTVIIQARAPGFSAAEVETTVSPGRTTRGIMLQLDPAGSMEGTVVSAAGEAVVGALVFLVEKEGESGDRSGAAVKSDADGKFRFDHLEPGEHRLRVKHQNFVDAVLNTVVAAGAATPVELVMSGGGAVEGVVSLAGKPLADANVMLNATSVKSDTKGKYRVSGLASGEFHLRVDWRRGEISRSVQETVTVLGEEVVQLDVDLRGSGAVLEGVVYVDETPATEGTVTVSSTETGLGVSSPIHGGGSYRLDDLPAGVFELGAHVKGAVGDGIRVNLLPGQALQQDLTMRPGVSLKPVVEGIQGEEAVIVGLYRGEINVQDVPGDVLNRDERRVRFTHATAQQPQADFASVEVGLYTLVVFSLAEYEVLAAEVVDATTGAGETLEVVLVCRQE